VHRAYIQTDDFVMSFRLMQRLHKENIRVEVLALHQEVPEFGILFSDKKNRQHANTIQVESDDIDGAMEEFYKLVHQIDEHSLLTIGIDPGPRPACAWRTDQTVVGVMQTESFDELFDFLTKLGQRYRAHSIRVKIGNGSPLHRDRIINRSFHRGYSVEEVDEKSTSKGRNRHDHTKAAIRIAMKSGNPIFEERVLKPSKGDVRNIQRESRELSNGKSTISFELAELVAVGEISMDEAILKQNHSSSE
jgi:hypothetical protein